MSNISQFFNGDTRKKNRKIFAGNQTVTWTAPPNTTEIDVHVWGGGGHGTSGGSLAQPGQNRMGGGGGGYVSNTFIVVGGTSTVAVSVGATASTSTATITNSNGPSVLTATGGGPGEPGTPAPTRGRGGSGSHSLHPAEPTAYVFTASGGKSYENIFDSPSYPTPLKNNSPASLGGGGAGFIYGPGGNGGVIPPSYAPSPTFFNPSTNRSSTASPGGGGFKGHGGFALSYDPPFVTGPGGAGGGFMPGGIGPLDNFTGAIAMGGAGISGYSMSIGSQDTGLEQVEWFYLEDIQGYGGSSGGVWDYPNHPSPDPANPRIDTVRDGLAGGGGGGAPANMGYNYNNSQLVAGNGGWFGGGGGGNPVTAGGSGGYAGGGGGGRFNSGSAFLPVAVSGAGGEGIIIIYY